VDWTPVFVAAVITLVILRVARARSPAARESRVVSFATGILSLGLLVTLLFMGALLIVVLGNPGP
jgi:uncharacterized membrane protein